MSVLDRLSGLFAAPEIEVRSHQCMDCGASVEADADACPDCGGEIHEEEAVETIPPYWGMY